MALVLGIIAAVGSLRLDVKAAILYEKPDLKTKNLYYFITSEGVQVKSGKARVVIRNASSKVEIPEHIQIQGKEYVVTEISANVTEYDTALFDSDKILNRDEKVYYKNTKASKVIIPKTVTHIEAGAFNRFTKLKKIVVSTGNTEYKSVKGALLSKDGKTFFAAPFVKGKYKVPSGVKTIAQRAFAYNKVTKVVLPKSCTTIKNRAFYKCTKLSSINLNKVNAIGKNVFYKTKIKNVNKIGNL